ncbi:MAG: YihA family ribosome biogenesis GTP-binding protein, partial [Caldimonas sp.]
EVGPKDAPDALFADLPGYGYAAVERSAKQRWQQVMADYLEIRRNLETIVLLADARLGLTVADHALLDFVAPRIGNGSVKMLVLLTKADKLPRLKVDAALTEAARVIEQYATDASDVSLVAFSALRGQGIADVAVFLRAAVRRT